MRFLTEKQRANLARTFGNLAGVVFATLVVGPFIGSEGLSIIKLMVGLNLTGLILIGIIFIDP